MKILRNSFLFLVSFVFLFSSLPVSAAESDLLPTSDLLREQLGLSQEEFDSMFNDDGLAIIDTPVPYTTSTIDEDISLQDGGIYYSYVNDTGAGLNGFTQFGQTVVINNNARNLQLILYNDDYGLFSTPGTLTLNCKLYAFSCSYQITYSDGSIESFKYPTDLTADVNSIVIQNPNANIVKISINLYNPISSSGDLVISGGILSYAYETYGAGNIFELLGRFIGGFFNNIMDSLRSVLGFNVENSSEISSSITDLENSENSLLGSAGSINDITFSDDVFEDASFLATVSWLGSLLQLLYVSTRFSSVFNITCTLLLAAIALGFARQWRGGSK